MRRQEAHQLTRHTINLYAGDHAKLQALYTTRIGAGKIVRDIIRAHIRAVEESAAQRIPLVDILEVELVPHDQEVIPNE